VRSLKIGRRAITVAALSLAAALHKASAQNAVPVPGLTLPKPNGGTILTLSGKIRHVNHGDTAVFDRDMLNQLGTASITTNTPWFDGPVRFDGVRMTTLMQAVGATGDMVTALALNDYSTDIPVADFARHGVILAMLRNGTPMRVSDKGPLFVVYPYDSSAELRTRQYYSRSAWSVAQLIVR
jgi:hypothetical protein